MACDVTIERLDTSDKIHLTPDGNTTLDQLLLTVAEKCGISPMTTSLFAFMQETVWQSPGSKLNSLQTQDRHQKPLPVNLQLRLRYKMPEWKNPEKPSILQGVDVKAFLYLYRQVRTDFESGRVCFKKMEKDNRWLIPIFNPIQSDSKDAKEERLQKLSANMMSLVAKNLAIDIIDGKIDRKEISKYYKDYIPKGMIEGLEHVAVMFTKSSLQNHVNRILQLYLQFGNSIPLMDNFVKQTEIFFPSYFCECYPAHFVEVGQVPQEVKLVCVPPKEDKSASLVMVKLNDLEKFTEVTRIDEICNIAVRDGKDIEISHKNGVPLCFSLFKTQDQVSLLTLLCSYYRLTEKWTFSLCTQVSFPVLESLSKNKVHGPIPKDFAEEKLKKTGFKKGAFLIRQCTENHRKYFLHYCSREGCRPEELIIREEDGNYFLDLDGRQVESPLLSEKFSCIGDLVRMLRVTPTSIEVASPVFPSEFDKVPSLLLCRNDMQWKEDILLGKFEDGREKIVINPRTLSKMEATVFHGRMCNVWKGEWRTKKERKEVALKQLHKSLKDTHQSKFLEMAGKSLNWDDGSLVNVFGFCMPYQNDPPVLVTEYFRLGPLSAYLPDNKNTLENVDLLEAAACLARALHYLSDNNLVHGEIRARNVFVCSHTESQFKVKLGEGSLDTPRKEDVHWLDFTQLQAALNQELFCTEIVATADGDIWSFGTTLWELFSFGDIPLQGMSWQEAGQKYLSGERLKVPPLLATGPLLQLGHILFDCWQPDVSARKQPQVLMRDIYQLFYKLFNSRRDHAYVTIDPQHNIIPIPASPPSPATVTPAGSISYSSHSSFSNDLHTPPVQCALVPMFTDISKKLLERPHQNSEFGSTSPLLFQFPTGSSRSGSIFTDISGLTCQTSLDMRSNFYSIDSIYQFEDSSVEYSKEFPLGEGNFGVVYKGVRTKSDGDWEEVAIKEIKDTDSMSAQAHDDMEREVSLMKKLSHDNIVKIRGVLANRNNTIIVMEFIREGSLDSYLRVNRHNIDYPKQLFGYAQNIADGMDYLGQYKIIHRDLAARNILVADQETVKISDFGLARQATNDFYVMNSSSTIPVRWEALECLIHRKYSHKSDVWSFGVTIWEMFAFGDVPALTGCQDFFKYEKNQRQDFRDWLSKLEEGVRLPPTELCPNFLYSRVMLCCWNKDPSLRPSFKELKSLLRQAELEVT